MKEQMKSVILPKLPIVGFLKLSTKDGKRVCMIDVVKNANPVELDPFFQRCHQEFYHFLTGQSKSIDIPLDYSSLTSFQLRVLKEMKKVSYGKVATYKDLADKLNSKGFQAIGSACGKNPFMLIYPCHRIVGTNNPGGFAHGLKMKTLLLELEGYSLKSKP